MLRSPVAGPRRRPSPQAGLALRVLLLGAGCWLASQSFVGLTAGGVDRAGANGDSRGAVGCSTVVRRLFAFGTPTGSENPLPTRPPQNAKHYIKKTPMYPPWPAGMEEAMFGMGCFWCSDNLFMRMEGVYSTQVGYAGGSIPNPSYNDVCTGASGHNEVVRVIYDPKVISFMQLLKVFWERHDPTTLNRQGNDRGTQYRSGIYYYSEAQKQAAIKTKEAFEATLKAGGLQAPIVTEIVPAPEFYYAEDYHQQYDAKPGSRQYCGLSPTGATLELPNLAPAP